MKYYTSDLHFDHSNMIAYENRPWSTVEEMNEGLIARINGRVGPEDELYILGDFTIEATDQLSCDDKDLDLLFGGEE